MKANYCDTHNSRRNRRSLTLASAETPRVGMQPEAEGYALVVARFYEELADLLTNSATKTLKDAGVKQIDTYAVPGAFELPLAAQYAVESHQYAAVVCLGVVIRGETDHYDFVCGEAARGIQRVQLESGVPCAFGLLTVHTAEQAYARANGDKRDQGRHAAQAALTMVALREELRRKGNSP